MIFILGKVRSVDHPLKTLLWGAGTGKVSKRNQVSGKHPRDVSPQIDRAYLYALDASTHQDLWYLPERRHLLSYFCIFRRTNVINF